MSIDGMGSQNSGGILVYLTSIRVIALVAVGSFAIQPLRGGQTEEAAPAESDEVLEESRQRVGAIAIYERRADADVLLEPVDDPVLRYGDPTRANKDGSAWIWGNAGRPRTVLELYRNNAGDWVYVFNWLTGQELRAERDGVEWWTPASPTVEFHRLDTVAPAGSSNRRTAQFRTLARDFQAHEFWDPDNSRYELRLLATPIHRYEDVQAGITDGAVFAFANGTNPEVLLLLEVRDDGEVQHWYYGLARLGHAEMHVALGETEIWTVPRVDPSRRDEPYWLHYDPALEGARE
jgi:hypothetical protein